MKSRKQRSLSLTLTLTLAVTLAVAACNDSNTTGVDSIAAPTVAVNAGAANKVTLTITAPTGVTGITGYNVERAAGASGGSFGLIGTTTTSTYEDTNVQPTTTYRYRVAAVKGAQLGSFSTEVVATTPASGPKTATITGDITSNRTLFADTIYTLSGFVHVTNGATLTIQPGTKILGDASVLGSSLFILRGAKIIANGTAAAPIVFTSSMPSGQRKPGDWGGLIIVGNGVINRTGTVQVEGTGTVTGNTPGTNYVVNYSGGTDNTDSSGSLSYVRVEFAGFAPSDGNELNAFTFAAVGSGTKLDHLEALSGLDDSFEFFGGAVDGKYLVSYESGDDHFDMSEGYSGRLQFLIGLQTKVLTPRAGAGTVATDPEGIENDGCNGTGCTNGFSATPLTLPIVANFTLIGRGDANTISSAGDIGMMIRRGTGGYYVNGVVGRWSRAAVSVRDAETQSLFANGNLQLGNILMTDVATMYQPGQQIGVDAAANNLIQSPAITSSLYASLPTTPTSESQLNWAPASNSLVLSGGLSAFVGPLQARAGTFITATSYRGATTSGDAWWQGWTYYAQN